MSMSKNIAVIGKRTANGRIIFIGISVAILLFSVCIKRSYADANNSNQTVGTQACAEAAIETKYPHEKWAQAKPDEVGLKAKQLEAIDEFLKSCGAGSSGLVLRHGKVAHTWGDTEKRYDVASCTKSFTSTAIGLAIADKKLSLDDKIYKYVPQVVSPKDKNITIAHLLSMTSEYGRPGLPGEVWAYSGAVDLLSPVINAKYNMTMANFMRIRVLEPIGAMNWEWPSVEKSDGGFFSIAAGGLNISASDMARFGYLFLNNGCWEGKRLVPKEWVALATRSSQDLNPVYGYLWWVNTAGNWPGVPKDSYCAIGMQSRDILFVCPSLDLIAVRLGGESLGDTKKLPVFLKLVVDSIQN